MKLEPHRVGGERSARQSRPLDRAFALLDPLLGNRAIDVPNFGMTSVKAALRLFLRQFGSPRNGFKRIDHHYAQALSAYPVSVPGGTSIWHGVGTEKSHTGYERHRKCVRHVRHMTGSYGRHDNYGFALSAQPGESQRRPATNSSSRLCIALPALRAPGASVPMVAPYATM
jgi:hypothetical protein